jgi:P-aminobenzoate N-oxygenase AurF
MDDELAAPGRAGPLGNWYHSAGVRTGVRRVFLAEMEQGKVFFPGHLVPYLAHEDVRALPPGRARELTVRHLYQFLLSATHMETRIVNRAAELIATNRAGLDLPARARLDAFKVYCDEAYHALYSQDLADQIAAVTGIPIPPCDYGALVDRLHETGNRLLPGEPRLVALLQVVVFETLITSVLNELPNDASVVTAVRDVMRDHARDEGRHHRFFAAFLHELWAQLDSSLRVPVALMMPALIRGCLLWDVDPVRSSLELAGLDAPAADRVVRDCYNGASGAGRIREICQATVRSCRSAGILAVPGAEEEFAAHGLLGDESRPDRPVGRQ